MTASGIAPWERLPPDLRWVYTHEGSTMAITVGYGPSWPEILVIVQQRGTGLRIAGQFGEDGRIRQFMIETTDGEPTRDDDVTGHPDITAAVLRRPVLGTLREWHAVGREAARQLLSGVPQEKIIVNGVSADEAMRILMAASGRTTASQRARGARREALIRAVAKAYRVAVGAGDRAPRVTLAEEFGLSHAHIGKLLTAARCERKGAPAVLGPAIKGRAGEAASADLGNSGPLPLATVRVIAEST